MDFKELAGKLGLEKDEFIELLRLFMTTGRTDLDRIQAAIDEDNAERVFAAAHSIKGASENLGFPEISSIAREVEHNARKHVLQGSADAVVKIREQLAAIERMLPSGEAPSRTDELIKNL
jgi:HPt (histidine-containing phosphotransfer) domain-containing protein